MSLYALSIRRPVLATVFALVICLFGALAIFRLGIKEYPTVDPPVVTIDTKYPGASAEIIDAQITEPIEEEVNAAAGIRVLESTSSEGRSSIKVEFDLETDLEEAANEIRDRVSRAINSLPPDAEPPVIRKADANRDPVVILTVASDQRDLLELSDLALRVFKERLQTIPGVAEASIWGDKEYSMRIYLDRLSLAAYGLTIQDVRDAIESENVELPSGRIQGKSMELEVKALGRLSTTEEFENIVLARNGNATVRLGDVGRAVLAPVTIRSILKTDGIPMVAVALRPQPGSNQIAIADEFHARLDALRKSLPPDVRTEVFYDATKFVRASIREVAQSILVALVLVVMIIYLFLRDWRATIIPAIAIPVSLLGGFFLMYLAGFSINVLTLLAMVLAIGLVVDDSIVVMENIYAKIEQKKPPREAGIAGTREIFFAVIATTLALAAVFLPILFLSGLTGRLFREFGVVLAGTVLVSSFVALTLTPMLSTKLLGGHFGHSRFYHWTEPLFQGLGRFYRRSLEAFLTVRWLAFPLLIAAALFSYGLLERLPRELAPLEDRSTLRVYASGPEGASFDYMDEYMIDLGDLLERETPEMTGMLSVTSPGWRSLSSGFARLVLTDPEDRARPQSEIARDLMKKLNQLPGARARVVEEQSLSNDDGSPVEFVIQAPSQEALKKALPGMLRAAEADPAFARVDVDLEFNKPDVRVEIDRDRARNLGVSTRAIAETLALALSERRINFFNMNGRQYEVILQLNEDLRRSPLDLQQIQVRSESGNLIRLDQLVRFEEGLASPQLYRFNRFPSATISADLAPGRPLGEALARMQAIADEQLAEGFQTDLGGLSRDFMESSGGLFFVFLLALILVYLVLAAQFESFRDPFVIMLTVPLAVFGALLGLAWWNQTLNIFSQIGLIMLVGLVTKNGILIVEFANQRKNDGLDLMAATVDAAVARLRPVLMTALSTILGILPIALALGAGSQSRAPMGIAVVTGMAVGTFLTLYIIPAIYTFFTARRAGQGLLEEAEERRASKAKEPATPV